mgnify:CR=1 FL=1
MRTKLLVILHVVYTVSLIAIGIYLFDHRGSIDRNYNYIEQLTGISQTSLATQERIVSAMGYMNFKLHILEGIQEYESQKVDPKPEQL